MLAQHPKVQFYKENNLSDSYKISESYSDYAFGYYCDNHGTVMTYSRLQIAAYSSPFIKFAAKPCGKSHEADNRKQVLNWIEKNLSK